MRHEQSNPSECWEITHNLNTDKIQVECWTEVGTEYIKILPLSINMQDQNTVVIEFTKPRTGFVKLINKKRWCDS